MPRERPHVADLPRGFRRARRPGPRVDLEREVLTIHDGGRRPGTPPAREMPVVLGFTLLALLLAITLTSSAVALFWLPVHLSASWGLLWLLSLAVSLGGSIALVVGLILRGLARGPTTHLLEVGVRGITLGRRHLPWAELGPVSVLSLPPHEAGAPGFARVVLDTVDTTLILAHRLPLAEAHSVARRIEEARPGVLVSDPVGLQAIRRLQARPPRRPQEPG